MDKFWNMTIDFLAEINTKIPLAMVLWVGLGLIGIVLIWAITGCALRKRLVPQWLIWIYFVFATLIIFAQADGDIFTVVAHMEVPCLVVLICYLLRLVFYRRPRYTYTERTVCVRAIDKTPSAKKVKENNEDVVREVETTVVEEVKVDEVQTNEVQDVNEDENQDSDEGAEVAFEVADVKDDIKFEDTVAEEQEPVETKAENADAVETKVEEKVEETTTVDMPVVEPISGKNYEAPREPGIVTTPVSETIPELKSTINTPARPSANTSSARSTSFGLLSSANRSTSSSSLFASRPSATTTTSATTGATSTTARPNAFASMYSPRTVKTTTTTTTTTNTNAGANTLNASSSAVRATSGLTTGLNRPASTSVTSAPKTTRSTDDIMAAIARLRASMKK